MGPKKYCLTDFAGWRQPESDGEKWSYDEITQWECTVGGS